MDRPRFLATTVARPLGALALVLALLALGSAGWLRQSTTAFAPEPARLTVDLVGSTGATGAAVYVHTNAPTTVLKWPGSYTSSANPPDVGTPCSTTDLPPGAETRKVLQGAGSIRRCF